VISFDTEEAGSSPEAAFTLAVEDAKWNWGLQGTDQRGDELTVKAAFKLANKPKGVSADRFIEWVKAAVLDPDSPKIPDHHRKSVLEAARMYTDPEGPALAITCSYAETTDFLMKRGREMKRGMRRPYVYRFIGTVK
jgi:hypothetical protein